jgi:hypothetical protein
MYDKKPDDPRKGTPKKVWPSKQAIGKTKPAIEALAASPQQIDESRRADMIHAIIDKAAEDLEKLGLKYFIGGVDRQPKATDGGKVYTSSAMNGEDFTYMLDIALPTKQDAINLGIWVGQIVQLRSNGKTNEPQG